ncbi:putative disease resistance protein [Rosa sericea]
MAELVAGALLSSFLSVWFDRLASGQVKDFIRGQKTTEGLLKKLEIKLLSVNKVLDDAEEKQIRDPTVRKWLDELKDVVYAAGDVLDEINTEALRRKLEVDQSGSSSACCQVPNFIYSTWFNTFERTLERRIVEILDRLEFIIDQKDVLGLKRGVQVRQQARMRETTSLVDDSDVYGRDKDKETIIALLLSDDAAEDKVGVVPIVGMGGIGKTTLAQLVYNDARVKEEFDLRAWVCVSDYFDILRITQAIYASITSQTCAITELDLLQVKLKQALATKKFLIVHDDIWNENYNHWDLLRLPFGSGAHGSKILVTTRNSAVASTMGTLPTYHLGHVSEEDCWLLFARHAFRNADALTTEHPDLANIGRKIVQKCNDLPLAAKSLGGLLRTKLDIEEWQKILDSEIWEFSEKESNILPALWLSYHYLPSHLKSCFAYCSMFPKDYNFTKSELVLLWLADDLLQPTQKNTVEEVGEDYFNYLVSRSFFQRSLGPHIESSITKHDLIYCESSFTMHDLMNDLAKFVSGDFCLRLEDNVNDGSFNIIGKTRQISYMKRGNHGFEFDALYKSKSLHTFLSFPVNPQYQYRFEMPSVLYCLLPTLQYLRFLNLSQYYVRELPSSIGNLKHLRHLDLSDSSIERLPDTLCTLYNMQSLLLGNCRALVQLPTNLGRLIKLRHLDISNRWGSTTIKNMPQDIGNLKSLQLLSNFVLAKDTGHSVVELKELQNLHQTLCISGLDHIFCDGDALEANLRVKKYLNGLVLKWGGDTDSSEKDRKVLEKLQPHTNLRELKIESYGGTIFPNWLPSLVKLEIEGLNEVVSIGLEFCGSNTCGIKPFRSLKDMSEWQEWCYVGGNQEEGGIFPNLCRLHLQNCPKLTEILPLDNLPKLEEISLLGLMSFGGSFSLESQCPKFLCLSELVIRNCPNFVCFPDEGMDAPQLTSICIENCVKFRSLPDGMHTLLSSLEYLHIDSCPELESFPEGGLPESLKSLEFGCNKTLYANSKQWGVQRLNSLIALSIIFEECEGIVDSFPEEGLLPTSLTHLHLSNHLNLTTIDGKALGQLKSLKRLIISNCPKLKRFSEEGLPTSLSRLEIAKCPLLEQRCQTEKGEDWPKISHIPSIYICD